MRTAPIIVAIVVVGLLALAALPTWAQPLPPFNRSTYLPIVFRALNATATPSRTATSPPSQATATASRTATSTPSNTTTPTATTQTGSGFPPVGAGTPTRTQVVPSKPIFTNGQDLWNCNNFGTWADANFVFQANKPGDPNKLDQNNDDIPCETLPGAP